VTGNDPIGIVTATGGGRRGTLRRRDPQAQGGPVWAKLGEADLRGADLRKVTDLTQEQLESARGDAETKLPAGFVRPASRTGPAAGWAGWYRKSALS
jgi:hypothetical protein